MSTLSTLAGQAGAEHGAGESKPQAPAPLHDDGAVVDVIPYDARTDASAHLYLPWLWERLKRDGLVSLYFPGAEQTGFAALVALCSSDLTRVCLVVKKDADGTVVDTIGFATWEPARMGYATMAHAGFIFLKDYWDRKTSVAAARRIMRLWFDEIKLDVMVGLVATGNHLAMRFMQRVGWSLAGTLPGLHQYHGKQSDAAMWYITRSQFEQGEKEH